MKIFISYSSKNRSLVQNLASDLESSGHQVWFDKELTGGHQWWSQILHSIRDADLFIFALTPFSLDSHPCRLEYTYANSLNKRVLPVLLERVNTNLLPPALSILQFVDFQERKPDTIFNLVRALNSLPPAQPMPSPLPAEPEVPLSPLGKLNERINAPALDVQEQKALLFDLKELLDARETRDDARMLLKRLAERDDIVAKVAEEAREILHDKPPRRPVSSIDLAIQQPMPYPAMAQPKSKAPARSVLVIAVVLIVLIAGAILCSQLVSRSPGAPNAPTATATWDVNTIQPAPTMLSLTDAAKTAAAKSGS